MRYRKWLILAPVLTGLGVIATVAALLPAQAGTTGVAAQTSTGPALNWADCADGFQCATMTAPMDYAKPRGRSVSLAMIKLPATDPSQRIGSLFVNFGGPGASGISRLRARAGWAWLFSPELRARFDLVSWDTRGVGQSTAVRCFDTEKEQQAFFATGPAFPLGADEEKAYYNHAADLAQRCRERNGDLLDHVSTGDTARDLDLMRRAVGDKQLSYFGLSYGTNVGATYANLFPDRVRALVLDGALDFAGNATGHGVDGHTLPIDTRQDVPAGIADTFDHFLTLCTAAKEKCAFSGGDPRARFAELTAQAKRAPIVADGQTWTYAAIISDVVDNLYRAWFWADLARQLQSLYSAATSARIATASGALPAHVRRGEQYVANQSEAFFAINCADSDVPRDPAVYSRLAVTEEQRVPYFGPVGVFDYMPCAFWQSHGGGRYTGPWNRRTAAPILVVNNRHDPATSLPGAQDATAELGHAGLLVVEGGGHTGMFVPSTCGERAKREYLFTGVLPAPGTTCAADNDPFGPPFGG